MTDDAFLETGYESTTPAGDTYLRRFLLNWCECNELAATAVGAAISRTNAYRACDAGKPAGYANTVTLLRPLFGDGAEVMAEIERFHTAQDGPLHRTTYLMSPWPTPDLRRYGWRLGGHPPIHILPPGKQRPPQPSGLRIETVTTPEQLALLERVAIDGYPFEDMARAPAGALMGTGLLESDTMRLWLGFVGNKPVAGAIANVAQGINHVMLVVTLPRARRRGFGEAVTWEAALADPALPAMLVSSDDGRPVYDRMGFLPVLRFAFWYRFRLGTRTRP
jgi:hypothetical protein